MLCVQRELATYSPGLLQKRAVILANKMDLLDKEAVQRIASGLRASTNLPVLCVSAKEHVGIDELITLLLEMTSSGT